MGITSEKISMLFENILFSKPKPMKRTVLRIG